LRASVTSTEVVSDIPVEAVVQEAVGEIEEELAVQGL